MLLPLHLEDKISMINKKSLLGKGIFVETGSGGNTVASHFYRHEGASNTVLFSMCPYSKESQEHFFGNCGFRSVSENQCYFMLNSITNKYTDADFVYVSTFQIASTEDVNTHGWIGIKIKNKTRYFHITIDKFYKRHELIDLISVIGLQLLVEFDIDNNKFSGIDIVLDENLNDDLEMTLRYNQNNEDVRIYLNPNPDKDLPDLARFEEYARKESKIAIYKGSFNPIHNNHMILINKTYSKYGTDTIMSISLDTYQKGKIRTKDIIDRCMVINKLGLRIIIFGSGFYNRNLKNIRHRYKKEVIFIIGSDTMERVLDSFTDIQNFTETFQNVKFFTSIREGCSDDLKNKLSSIPNIEISDLKNLFESSTNIRKMISEGKDISERVPIACLETIKKIYYDK